ncbi:DUF1150 family protein [Puniceibacterium confluentis]|uniref:DUF1150 family protein n=1 Tax=Puniceibacterium confluentis TaxID=1958944 RepID=UPI0011B3F138|nr:DUF1150 family protein [Puniceibacterium confluentis]
MNTSYNFDGLNEERLVYVRPVLISDLPAEVQEQVEDDALEILYAVHRADGERLALVANRGLAFSLAIQNDLAPVTVH